MKRLLLFLQSSMFLLIFNLPSVYACSYGEIPPPTVDTMLDRDVLVRGIIIENNAGNSIIEVERYLQGTGSRYLLLSRQSPANYVIKAIRGYAAHACDYSMSAVADVGTRAYFSLSRAENGAYHNGFFAEQSIFPIVDDEEGHFVHYWEDVDGSIEFRRSSEDEFEQLIAERTGNNGTVPSESSRMPRFRVLTIRTESGQAYQLPVDSNEIQPITINPPCSENCPIVSPDGSHYAVPNPNEADAYWAWFYASGEDWSQGIGEGEARMYPSGFHAQSLIFSPDSEYILAWYEDSISLYAFNTWSSSGVFGYYPNLAEVWSAQLALTETETAERFRGLGAWSANSNAIAYWDADGLKWLDINMMRVPRLILESEQIQGFAQSNQAENIPPLLELSSTGRYLRYGDREEWRLLDLLTGMEYDDLLISPDETRFLAVSPEEFLGQTVRNMEGEEGDCIMFSLQGDCLMTNERPFDYCILPMTTCSGYYLGGEIREVHWHGDTGIVYLRCEDEESNLCFAMQRNFDNRYSSQTPESRATNAFAYDEHYGHIAWAIDDYYLRLDAYVYSTAVDLSTVLDSPIVSLEWGAPLWYLGE